MRGEAEGADRRDEGGDCRGATTEGRGQRWWATAGGEEGQAGKEEKLIKYETYGTIELTKQGESLAQKILEAYDIVYLFLKDVLNLEENAAKEEAEKIKLVTTDETINKLAKYIHNVLGLRELNCNYDINQEKCRSCIKRTSKKI